MNLFSCQRKLLSKTKKKKKVKKRTSDVGKSRNHHLYKLKAERDPSSSHPFTESLYKPYCLISVSQNPNRYQILKIEKQE
ncbi:unnamed protein product [Brassica rapa]|uniref:BnaA09g11040D protein n=2 Tax=Brassica TaxID=3705 RepID=A0A078H9M0_BRANA|nr:unnamed protein product [Brassica rapa]CDY34362.1 BnaA09g11040D [Brassica napus]VDC59414.1 unnamed protein product [Brassica rapa]